MTTLTDDELLAWLESGRGFSAQAQQQLAARFRELLAQQEWQPIDTAPDHTPILAYGIWQGEINGIGKKTVDIIQGPVGTSDADDEMAWWGCLTGDAYACWLKPTHWRPLPAPPKDA